MSADKEGLENEARDTRFPFDGGGEGLGSKRTTAQNLKTGYYIRQLDWAPIFAAQDFYFRRFSSQKLEQLLEYQFQS